MAVHELIFYNHWDLDAEPLDAAHVQTKQHLLDQHGMAVIRRHDTWKAVGGEPLRV